MASALFLACLPAGAESFVPVSCQLTKTLPDGSKVESLENGKEEIKVQGENEAETISLKRNAKGKWTLRVASTVDGAPYITDSVSCDRYLSCSGERAKTSAKKTKKQKFTIVGGNYLAKIQLKERLLFTFYRKGEIFVFTYLNYPLPKGGFVGAEFSCTGK